MIPETELHQKIDRFIAEQETQLFADLKTLIDICSVRGEPAENAPFGQGVRQVMDAAMQIAQRMGLATHDCEGRMVYAEVPGKSDKQIATITHLDVVPAGHGWSTDPFCMIERDGFVLGRGVADDKGPALLTLYLAYFFSQLCRETGAQLPYTLRILLGGAEETGMEDIDYYLEHYPMPAFCFTPDGSFPVGHGEKGGFGGHFTSERFENGKLIDFQGGVADNVVPDRAFAIVRADAAALPQADQITIENIDNGTVRITAQGKGGHASAPQGTINAIALVVSYLLTHQLCSPQEQAYLSMLAKLMSSTDGSSFDMAASDDIFTPLTCIGGVISMKNGTLSQSIDIRFPTGITVAQMTHKLNALAAEGSARFTPGSAREPFYVRADAPAIQACIQAYNEVTGRNEKPFTMGGGTYARHFTNAVSFGMEEPDAHYPDFIGQMHGANEGVPKALLLQALKIYLLATARLMQLEL